MLGWTGPAAGKAGIPSLRGATSLTTASKLKQALEGQAHRDFLVGGMHEAE